MEKSIQEEDNILVNIDVLNALNLGEPKYIKQILTNIKGKIDGNTLIVGDFNTQLISMDRFPRQKINMATEILSDIIEQLNLIDIFKTLHQKKKEKKRNKHSIQVNVEYSPRLTTSWVIEITSTNLRV